VALAAGENVVATARNPDQLEDLVERYPGSARAVRLDVADRAQAAAAVEATIDAFGRLDVLVNNAGVKTRDLSQQPGAFRDLRRYKQEATGRAQHRASHQTGCNQGLRQRRRQQPAAPGSATGTAI
jgi:NAD(P)-dependent dehydrogenase (short-subunit alcohol dehydrogenase family)